jgi:hypothetical protein
MSKWYNRVTANSDDLTPLLDAITFFDAEIKTAMEETKIQGSLEQTSARLPGITAMRYSQLQETEAILKYLELKLLQTKGKKFKHYLHHYNKELSSRDADKFAESDEEVIQTALLVNQFSLIRNRFLAVMKGLDQVGWQVGNLTRLKVAGMEDYSI